MAATKQHDKGGQQAAAARLEVSPKALPEASSKALPEASPKALNDCPGEAYILSVRWPPALAKELDALREAYFPPHRNHLPAHLTMFHALPGGRLRAIAAELRRQANATPPLQLAFVGPFDLGHGVALRVRSAPLEALRARLVEAFGDWLTAQDRAKFRAHVTVQNKVGTSEARRTLHALEMAWNPNYVGKATGLTLSRYAGGPWEHTVDFPFTATAQRDATAGEKE